MALLNAFSCQNLIALPERGSVDRNKSMTGSIRVWVDKTFKAHCCPVPTIRSRVDRPVNGLKSAFDYRELQAASPFPAQFWLKEQFPPGRQPIAAQVRQLMECKVNGVGKPRDFCQEAAMPEALTILIADDEPLLTELLEFRLAARGFRTIVASDGREALARFAKDKPHAIVLDAMMPVHDGFEVLRRIRSGEVNPQTPVIMLSARRGEQDIVGALELGANDYLVKPFLPEELLVRLGRLLK